MQVTADRRIFSALRPWRWTAIPSLWGAYAQDAPVGPVNPADDRGAVYVYTRSGSVWTEQTRISPASADGGAAGNHFGVAVDLSGDTLIAGARTATASGTARAGTATSIDFPILSATFPRACGWRRATTF